MLAGFGPLVGGTGAGSPGFSGSSSAASSAGPVTVGGLTFAPDDSSTMVAGVVAVAAVIAVLLIAKGR